MKNDKPNLESLILVFRRKIIEVCKKEGLPYDLSFSQAEIIRFIGPKGKETMRSIADHLKVSPPSVTEMVYELEKKGAIERKPDSSDRRVVSIILTKKAKRIYSSMVKHKESVLEEMLSRLNADDRKTLERIITILVSEK